MYGPTAPSFAPVISTIAHSNEVTRPPSRSGRTGPGQSGRRRSRSRHRSRPKVMVQQEEIKVHSTYRSRLVEVEIPQQSDESVGSDGRRTESEHDQHEHRGRQHHSNTPARGWRTADQQHQDNHSRSRHIPPVRPTTPAPRGRSQHRRNHSDDHGPPPSPIHSRPPSRAAGLQPGQSSSRRPSHHQAPSYHQEPRYVAEVPVARPPSRMNSYRQAPPLSSSRSQQDPRTGSQQQAMHRGRHDAQPYVHEPYRPSYSQPQYAPESQRRYRAQSRPRILDPLSNPYLPGEQQRSRSPSFINPSPRPGPSSAYSRSQSRPVTPVSNPFRRSAVICLDHLHGRCLRQPCAFLHRQPEYNAIDPSVADQTDGQQMRQRDGLDRHLTQASPEPLVSLATPSPPPTPTSAASDSKNAAQPGSVVEDSDSTSESDDSGGDETDMNDRSSARFKSELCKQYQRYLRGKRKGRQSLPKCEAGDACPKVHIAGRDAKRIMSELRRSRKCPYVVEGICSRSPTCDFKHGSSDSFLDVSADIGSDGE